MTSSDDDQAGVPLFEALSDSDSPSTYPSGKRKRANDDSTTTTDPTRAKKQKKRKSKKPQDIDDEALDLDLGINHAIAHMDTRLLVDHVAQRTRRFQPDLSIVELEDCYLPEKALSDTTSWDKPRTIETLPAFLEHFATVPKRKKKTLKLSEAASENGSPHTLVVAGAGLRAADLARVLRKFQTKNAMIAKLFAKHIKFKEAVEMVKKSRMGIGIGTPQRLIDLLNDGALSISHLERIVIDASHIDQKKRGILDMKETQVPLVQLLTRSDLVEKYGAAERKIELLFF